MRSALALRIRWELLHFCIASFEAAWVYAWVEALHAPDDVHISFGALWFYAIVLFTLSRFVVAQETWTDRQRWLVLSGTAVGLALVLIQLALAPSYGLLGLRDLYSIFTSPVYVFFGFVNPLTTAGLAFFLIWFRLVHTSEFLATSYRFRVGVLFLFAALIVDTASPSVGIWVPVFYFFAGLLAIALARAEDVSTITKGEALPFTRQWLMTLLAGVIVMFAVASLVAFLLSDRGMAWLAENFPIVVVAGRWLVHQLQTLLYYVAAFIMWLLSPIFIAFQKLVGTSTELSQLEIPPTPTVDETQASSSFDIAWLRLLLDMLKIVVPLIVTAFLFWLGFEMSQRDDQTDADIQAEFARTAATDTESDESWLDKLRARGRRFLQQRWQRPYRTDTVRDLYANLLILGEKMGHPRHPEQTPLEYWAQLRMIWPSLDHAIWKLTHTYVQTRYGHEPVDEETLNALRETWENIRQTAPLVKKASATTNARSEKSPI